jgi:hypothetical protein
MNIHSQDHNLLLLAHSELRGALRLKTQVHVVFCSRCRTRLEKMEGASLLLADTIRGGDMSRWHLPTSHGAVAAARTATLWLTTILVAIVFTLAVVILDIRNEIAPRGTQTVAPTSGGCRPDLPSDKCR